MKLSYLIQSQSFSSKAKQLRNFLGRKNKIQNRSFNLTGKNLWKKLLPNLSKISFQDKPVDIALFILALFWLF